MKRGANAKNKGREKRETRRMERRGERSRGLSAGLHAGARVRPRSAVLMTCYAKLSPLRHFVLTNKMVPLLCTDPTGPLPARAHDGMIA